MKTRQSIMADLDSEPGRQVSLFEVEETRSMLDEFLAQSRLYTRSKDYHDLLDFVVMLRNFAPFNAMLLHLQKPGLSYASSAFDWARTFGRKPKPGARPLLILWPFGPVALVYDVMDTEGKPLPQGVASFSAKGDVDAAKFISFLKRMSKKHIECVRIDSGDNAAGEIRVVDRLHNEEPALKLRHLHQRQPPSSGPIHNASSRTGSPLLGAHGSRWCPQSVRPFRNGWLRMASSSSRRRITFSRGSV